MQTLSHPSRLLEELAASNDPTASSLLSRMTRCGSEEWNHQFTCRTPACDYCRGRYIGSQSRAAIKRFSAVTNDDLAFASIVIGATGNVSGVGDIFAKFKKDFRNLSDANRRERRRWLSIFPSSTAGHAASKACDSA